MNRLWMLLFLLGCKIHTPTQITEEEPDQYYLNFIKSIDTIFVDVSQRQITETQTTKHIGAVTNMQGQRMVLLSSNIYVQVTAGFGHIDTVSTINQISHSYKGYIGTVFGAFPNMVGMTATIIAKMVDDIHTPDEYANPHLRRVLAADTMEIVVLPRQ